MHVERFLHDELIDSLPTTYDLDALINAGRATYVLHQDISYEYTKPITRLRQRLVVLPREHHGDQRRIADRLDVHGCQFVTQRSTDRFGNVVIRIDADAVPKRIDFVARSAVTRAVVDTSRHGIPWAGATPSATRLTAPDADVAAAALQFRSISGSARLADELGSFIRASFTYAHDATTVRTTAAQAWRDRAGVCQDMAHVMISMCTSLGVPARYVSGHLVGDGASHAWVEVLETATGQTIAVDPTHARRCDLRYITTAVGRDYCDVAPTTGTYESEGGSGRLSVHKKIRLAELA